jgi:serine/threonine protein kinase
MMDSKCTEYPKEVARVLELFPQFELSSVNYSGANGYVLIGKHVVLRRDDAIKIYFYEDGDIDQEPTIISRIDHDNVLKVYDARKVEANCSCFLMPAANEGDLSSYLSKYHISTTHARKLLCQLLSGVSALHGKPNYLVHRDLKPENLLIHEDRMVIADFGSVLRIDQETQKVHASRHSILYRPLEAFGPGAFFSFSSDIYQAGIIGFLLFGGSLDNDLTRHMSLQEVENLSRCGDSFEKSKFVDNCIYCRINSGKLLRWEYLPFYVPKSIKRILKTATSPIDKRYKNVSDFIVALTKVKNLPDWIVNEEGLELQNWKGYDYLIHKKDNMVLKRKHGKQYRADKQYVGDCPEDLYAQLKEGINLP